MIPTIPSLGYRHGLTAYGILKNSKELSSEILQSDPDGLPEKNLLWWMNSYCCHSLKFLVIYYLLICVPFLWDAHILFSSALTVNFRVAFRYPTYVDLVTIGSLLALYLLRRIVRSFSIHTSTQPPTQIHLHGGLIISVF